MKILNFIKIVFPIFILFFLYKYNYISFSPIISLLNFGDFRLISLIFLLSFLCSLFLYLRYKYCLKIYKVKVNFLKIIEVSSQAYSFAGFIPGQLGIDALRIGKLRSFDLSKFKKNLIKSAIIEKFFALLSQLFILLFFVINDLFMRVNLFLIFTLMIYILIITLRKIEKKNYFISKYTGNFIFKDIFTLFSISILSNFISCYLIKFIGVSLNMNYSLKVMSISSTLSNIAGVIPISLNGLGISEFIFSEITQNISNFNNDNPIATIYFTYRILNLFSHFIIFYITKFINLSMKEIYK